VLSGLMQALGALGFRHDTTALGSTGKHARS
jgi:hypothetical protein